MRRVALISMLVVAEFFPGCLVSASDIRDLPGLQPEKLSQSLSRHGFEGFKLRGHPDAERRVKMKMLAHTETLRVRLDHLEQFAKLFNETKAAGQRATALRDCLTALNSARARNREFTKALAAGTDLLEAEDLKKWAADSRQLSEQVAGALGRNEEDVTAELKTLKDRAEPGPARPTPKVRLAESPAWKAAEPILVKLAARSKVIMEQGTPEADYADDFFQCDTLAREYVEDRDRYASRLDLIEDRKADRRRLLATDEIEFQMQVLGKLHTEIRRLRFKIKDPEFTELAPKALKAIEDLKLAFGSG